MDHLGRNLTKIHDRLKARGYKFDHIIRYEDPLFGRVNDLPADLPLVLDVLRLGGISLKGSQTTWFRDLCGDDDDLPECSDVLYIDPPFAHDLEEAHDESTPPFLDLAPDIFMKDNISGGPPDGVQRRPDQLDPFFGEKYSEMAQHDAMAAYLENHLKPTSPLLLLQPLRPPPLLNYLRRSVLEGAGFPGFLRPSSCPASLQPLRDDLIADLEVF